MSAVWYRRRKWGGICVVSGGFRGIKRGAVVMSVRFWVSL